MKFNLVLASVITAFFATHQARADIRKVLYMTLADFEASPEYSPALDPDCNGPDPFATDWKTEGLKGGCPTGRIPSVEFHVGKKVPEYNSSITHKPSNVAILSLEEVEAMKAANPGATYRFEVKAVGNWTRKDSPFLPIELMPSSSCVSADRFADNMNRYKEKGIDWRSVWYHPRTKFSYGAKDYKAFQSSHIGLQPFNMFTYYDFDINECDAPLGLTFKAMWYEHIQLNLLEVNLYVCGANSGCTEVPHLY